MSKTLPSLFGRFTGILNQHEHLALTLRELRAMCRAIEDGSALEKLRAAPGKLVAELRDELSAHFDSEESAQYFGVVVEEEPRLGEHVAELKWQHLAMRRDAALLCELAADLERRAELAERARALIADLERHERAESDLLGRLFGADTSR
jgi:Hemerythrin HHE cation binding domain